MKKQFMNLLVIASLVFVGLPVVAMTTGCGPSDVPTGVDEPEEEISEEEEAGEMELDTATGEEEE